MFNELEWEKAAWKKDNFFFLANVISKLCNDTVMTNAIEKKSRQVVTQVTRNGSGVKKKTVKELEIFRAISWHYLGQ